jgi:hypothetical protein
MMRSLTVRCLTSMVVIFAVPSPARAVPCSLASLSWMAGSWHNSNDPTRAQERWVLAPDGVLMGSAWEFPKGHSGYAEVMTVRQDSSAIAMVLRHFDGRLSKAWEERDAPMVFTASRCERDSRLNDLCRVIYDGWT